MLLVQFRSKVLGIFSRIARTSEFSSFRFCLQPMSTALKTANFILEQCFISGRITKLRDAGQVQARSGMSH